MEHRKVVNLLIGLVGTNKYGDILRQDTILLSSCSPSPNLSKGEERLAEE